MMIHLPRTPPRRQPETFLKLLRYVDAFGEYGFGFDGTVFRCGAEIDTADLPRPAVVLECAGNAAPGRGQPILWILWRLLDNFTWRQVARAESFDWTWSIALRPVAVRELRGGAAEVPPADLPEITRRIVGELDRELRALPRAVRCHLLGRIERELNARIAEVA